MLNTPDYYNDFVNAVDENFKYKLENNLLPDFSKIDPLKLIKKSKKEYMAVIDNLVHGCSINDNYDKHKVELEKYTEEYILKNYSLFDPRTITNLVNNVHNNEFQNLIDPVIQSFLLYVELLRNLYFYIQEKYMKKNKTNVELQIIHCFIEYSLELLNGLDALLLGGNTNSAISIYRTFYETFIVFAFLRLHPELNIPFAEHSKMDQCLMHKEQTKLNNTKLPNEIEELYNSLINKYGTEYEETYGWAASVITDKKKRNLKTMFEEAKLNEAFGFYYKLACKFTHATSFSLQTRPTIQQLYSFLYAVINIINSEFSFLFEQLKINSNKERELLKAWLKVCSGLLVKNLNDFKEPNL